jgi:DHA1 family tetracycline resistance protein-like MFS transporter
MPRPPRTPLPPGFAAVWSTVAVDLVGFGIVLPLVPIYSRRFGASPFEAALLVAAFSGASFLAAPFWGRLSDRVGRKPVLIVSLVGTAAGSLITALAGGLVLLYVGRVIDGVSGASVAVAQATATDLAGPGQRPRLFGLLGAAFGLGFVAGPAIGAVAALAGPRIPFILAASLAGANAVVAVRRLPETRPEGAGGGWTLNPLAGLARGRGIGGLVGVAFLALVAFSGFEATLPLFGQRHLGFSLSSTGAVFAAVGVGIVAVEGGGVRVLVHRWGEMATLRLGLGLNVTGLALLAAASSWMLAAPALALLAAGQGLVQPTMASAVAGRVDRRRRGQALGAQQSAGGLARTLGPVAGGALLGASASGLPYLLGAALTAVALVLAVTAGGPKLLSSNIEGSPLATRQEV